MNKDNLTAELRKQGYGRIADLLDAEQDRGDVSDAEFTEIMADEELPKGFAAEVPTLRAKDVYMAVSILDGSKPFEIQGSKPAKKKAK